MILGDHLAVVMLAVEQRLVHQTQVFNHTDYDSRQAVAAAAARFIDRLPPKDDPAQRMGYTGHLGLQPSGRTALPSARSH